LATSLGRRTHVTIVQESGGQVIGPANQIRQDSSMRCSIVVSIGPSVPALHPHIRSKKVSDKISENVVFVVKRRVEYLWDLVQ
jgi:hypothetical protein